METVEFDMTDLNLVYAGDALNEGRIPVRELAEPLLALSDLFHRAQALAHPSQNQVSLEIKATERGSFDVTLHLSPEDLANLLAGPTASALANLIEYVCFLFALIKLGKGRKAHQETHEDGRVQIIFEGDNHGDVLVVPAQAAELFGDPTARWLAKEVVRPLGREGIDEMRFDPHHKSVPSVILKEEDLRSFEYSETAPLIERLYEKQPVIPIQFSFTPNYQWRFHMGDQMIRARIVDEDFFDDIHEGRIVFQDGDAMIVDLRMRERPRSEGDKAAPIEWTVLKVVRHIPRGAEVKALFQGGSEE